MPRLYHIGHSTMLHPPSTTKPNILPSRSHISPSRLHTRNARGVLHSVQDIGERQRGVWLGNESVVETLRMFRARLDATRKRKGPTVLLRKREHSNTFAADVFAFG